MIDFSVAVAAGAKLLILCSVCVLSTIGIVEIGIVELTFTFFSAGPPYTTLP